MAAGVVWFLYNEEDDSVLTNSARAEELEALFGRLTLSLFEILHNANAKDIASRTRAICSADRVVIKEPILPFDTV